MKFTKMHGIGNDYVYVNCFEENIRNPSRLAVKVSDRHFGIGSDGLVLIMPSKKQDFRMRMFNPDGSEAEMCGNAIRCVGKYVYDNGLTRKKEITIETLSGVKKLKLHVRNGKVRTVRVDMGEPVLEPEKIPVIHGAKKVANEDMEIGGKTYRVTCVSMGNPHAVTYMDGIDSLNIDAIGPQFEHSPLFPRGVNAEFVEVIDTATLKMRVWERGTGETLACGTGACASLVASVLNGFSDRKATVRLRGGDLLIEWNEQDNHVYMTGPAETVFEGNIDL
ncbi:MAG: diaminopimelate epimerase [Bacillota bacterium]